MGKRGNIHSSRVKANHSRMRAMTETLRMRRLESVCSRMAQLTAAPLDKYGLYFITQLFYLLFSLILHSFDMLAFYVGVFMFKFLFLCCL